MDPIRRRMSSNGAAESFVVVIVTLAQKPAPAARGSITGAAPGVKAAAWRENQA
jgi:hypothetical protein